MFLKYLFLPNIHIVQTIGTKWSDGRRFARGKLKGIRAKFMKKFQCFPYSSAPILKWAVTIPLITPKTKSGPDEMTSRLNLIFDGPWRYFDITSPLAVIISATPTSIYKFIRKRHYLMFTSDIPNVFDFLNRRGNILKSTADMAVIVIIIMQVWYKLIEFDRPLKHSGLILKYFVSWLFKSELSSLMKFAFSASRLSATFHLSTIFLRTFKYLQT